MLEKQVAAMFPRVQDFHVETMTANTTPVEFNGGPRTVREYPPVARWRVGDVRFSYALKPTFRSERWGGWFFGGEDVRVDYDQERETLMKLLTWSSEGKSPEEMNNLLRQ